MKKLLFAAALAFAPAAAFAQPQPAPAAAAPAAEAAAPLPDANPAMWVVRDDDTTIYLFGTFHMLDGRREWFNDEVLTAFDESDELVLEAVLPDDPMEIQPLIIRYAVDPDGRMLSQRLTAEQREALTRTLSGLGVPAQAMEPLEPWFVSMTMAGVVAQRLGLSPEHGPETILSAAARERGISVGELEGMEAQLQMLDGMPEDAQLAQLAAAIENIDSIQESLGPMLDAWSSGDVERLAAMISENMAEDPALHRIMFTDRNARWAEWVQQRLDRPGTVFVAVGAGHLAGDDSVQSVLAGRGIRSERVRSGE